MEKKYFISIGKITNFFGIKGEAKIGFSNENQIKNAKKVYIFNDSPAQNDKIELTIKKVRFQKNFAIIKFDEIDDINDLLEFKGQNIYIPKQNALEKLEKDEYLIQDLINCEVFDENNEKIGEVVNISTNSSQDLLNIKNSLGQVSLVPFVNEFFPVVDIKNKKIIIKPIEGLLS